MTYTEIRTINNRKYFYRVISIGKNKKVSKRRVYLGHDLSQSQLLKKEKEADKKLIHKKIIEKNRELEKIKLKIIKILKKNKVKKAGIFGSYSRSEQKRNSDIDIVVEIPDKKMSLLDFIGLKITLEDALGKKVDLVEYSAIKRLLKDRILKEEIRVI